MVVLPHCRYPLRCRGVECEQPSKKSQLSCKKDTFVPETEGGIWREIRIRGLILKEYWKLLERDTWSDKEKCRNEG